jgi:hypothetical protein
LPKGPTLSAGESQPTEDKALTPTGKSGDKSENPNLVSGLFFGSGFHASEVPTDLAKVIAAWPQLPEHIKAAIKALVQTHKVEQQQTESCGGGQS